MANSNTNSNLEYTCALCFRANKRTWMGEKSFSKHKKSESHLKKRNQLRKKIEKLTDEQKQQKYGEVMVCKIIKKNYITRIPFKKLRRSNKVIYEKTEEEIQKANNEKDFKQNFEKFLHKAHQKLRQCSVTGEDAMMDILYCLLLCFILPKASKEGNFDLLNEKQYSIKKTKLKDCMSKLDLNYLIVHSAELITDKIEQSSIYKIGELMSRHPVTKPLMKQGKKFINCKNPVILADILRDCRDFTNETNVFKTSDIIGYVWEYFNTKHGGNGGASKERGQYFTERPVMDMCLRLIEPSHLQEYGINNDSTLGDEFCGTFGFPLYAKKFLKEKFDISIKDENMYGVELGEKLAILAYMNALMILNNTKNIQQGDSFITNVKPHLDLSVHNVPFGGTIKFTDIKNTYNNFPDLPDINDVIPKQNGKIGGSMLCAQTVVYKTKKMGLLILEDGSPCFSDGAPASWRKWFCDSCKIHKIMKMPAGAFSFTNTKTACIYFTKKENEKTEKIQFLQMSEDGNKILEVCSVSRNDLEQNNYSWQQDIYTVDENREKLLSNSNCLWKKIEEIVKYEKKSKRAASYGEKEGKYPFFKSSQTKIDYVPNKDEPDYDEPHCIIGDGGGPNINYAEKFSASDHCFVFKSNSDEIKTKYIYYYIKNNLKLLETKYTGGGLRNMSKKSLNTLDIPIPTLETQNKIIQIIDDLEKQFKNYSENVNGGILRRMTYYIENMFKTHKDKVEIKKLGDTIKINIGITPSTKEAKYWENGTNPWVSIRDLGNTTIPITNTARKITDVAVSEKKPKLVKSGTTLMSFKLSIGKMGIAGCDLYTNEAILHMNTDNKISNKWFYYHYLCHPPTGASGQLGAGSLNTKKLKNLDFVELPDDIKAEMVKYLDSLEEERIYLSKRCIQIKDEIKSVVSCSYQ